MLAPLWFIVCLLSDAAAEPYIGSPYNMRGWGILGSSGGGPGNQLLAPPPAPAVPAVPAPSVPAIPVAAVPAVPVAADPAAVPPTVYVYCTLELQTMVPQDYAKIYNHREGPY